MGRQHQNRDLSRIWRRLEKPGCFPAIDFGKTQVHENQVGDFAPGCKDSLTAIARKHDFESASFETAAQHIPIHLIVLDEENLSHGLTIPYRHSHLTASAVTWTEQ